MGRGQLPKPQTEEVLQELDDARVRELIDGYKAKDQAAKRELPGKEQEAETLGLQVKGVHTRDLIAHLETARAYLLPIAHDPIEEVVGYFRREGITDADEIISRRHKARSDFKLVEEQLAVVRELRSLRNKAGVE